MAAAIDENDELLDRPRSCRSSISSRRLHTQSSKKAFYITLVATSSGTKVPRVTGITVWKSVLRSSDCYYYFEVDGDNPIGAQNQQRRFELLNCHG
jgi:hypothetical protein